MNFGIGSAFSKSPGSAFSEGSGTGQLYKVCPYHLLLPRQGLIWDYKKADTSNIRKAFDLINWGKRFSHKNINTQVTVFNETILNIFRHYVANKYITCDDKDPVWMNENIKSKRKSKKLIL